MDFSCIFVQCLFTPDGLFRIQAGHRLSLSWLSRDALSNNSWLQFYIIYNWAYQPNDTNTGLIHSTFKFPLFASLINLNHHEPTPFDRKTTNIAAYLLQKLSRLLNPRMKLKIIRRKSYPATKAKAFLLGVLRNPTVNTAVASKETARITSFQVLLWT